jgi:hypothetical protein
VGSSKQAGNSPVTPAGRLARLEHLYSSIPRAELAAKLNAAIVEQRALDDFIVTHAQDAREWTQRAESLTGRRTRALAAIDGLLGEIRECRLADQGKSDLADRLRALRAELDELLAIRTKAARFLASIARRTSMRGVGIPPKGRWVDFCFRKLLEDLARVAPDMTKAERLDYLAALAHECGAPDAGVSPAAVGKRIERLNELVTDRKLILFTRRDLEALRQYSLSFRSDGDPIQMSVGDTLEWARALAAGEWPPVPASNVQRAMKSSAGVGRRRSAQPEIPITDNARRNRIDRTDFVLI